MIYSLKNKIFKNLFEDAANDTNNKINVEQNKFLYGEFSTEAKKLFNLRDANGGRGEASLAFDLLSNKPDLDIINRISSEKSDKKILKLKYELLDKELEKIPVYSEIIKLIEGFDLRIFFPDKLTYDGYDIENDTYVTTTPNGRSKIKKHDNSETTITRKELVDFNEKYIENINKFLSEINEKLKIINIEESTTVENTKTQRKFYPYKIKNTNTIKANTKLFLLFFIDNRKFSESRHAKNFQFIFLDAKDNEPAVQKSDLTVEIFNRRFKNYLIGSVRGVIEFSKVYENILLNNPTYYFTSCITTGGKTSKSIDVQVYKDMITENLRGFFTKTQTETVDDTAHEKITIEIKELNQRDFISKKHGGTKAIQKTRNIGIRLASGSRQALLADDFLFYLVILGVLIKKNNNQYSTYKTDITQSDNEQINIESLKKCLVRFAFGEITPGELIFVLKHVEKISEITIISEDNALFKIIIKKINKHIKRYLQQIKALTSTEQTNNSVSIETTQKFFTSSVINNSINADYICLVAGISTKIEQTDNDVSNDDSDEPANLTDDESDAVDRDYNKCKFIIFRKDDLLSHFVLSKISMGGTLYMNFTDDVREAILKYLFDEKHYVSQTNTFLKDTDQQQQNASLEVAHVSIHKDKKLINEYKYLFKKEIKEKLIYRNKLIERLKNS